MEAKVQVAETEAQREAIYRLRYDIYVEEMNRYGSIADHKNRRLVEPDDAWSRLYFAAEGESIVGEMTFLLESPRSMDSTRPRRMSRC